MTVKGRRKIDIFVVKWLSAFVFWALAFAYVQAIIPTSERIEKCKRILNENSQDLEDLEKCKRILSTKVETTTQQKNILANQVKLYNLRVSRAENNLKNIEAEIKRNQNELKRLEAELEMKNKEMQELKEQLKSNIVLYEKNRREFEINLLNSESNLTVWMDRANYLNKLSEKINEKLRRLKDDKREILEKQAKIKEKIEEIEKGKKKLKREKEVLEEQRRIKNDFLARTAGDEAKYKAMLARIEAQKKLIMNMSSFSSAVKATVAEIKRKAKKPKSGLASTSWYYAQDDPRWGKKTIGFSGTLMKDYGCAVTSLAMVFTKEGEGINPGKLAKKPLFYQDLIVWPSKWGDLSLKYGRSHGNVSWSKINSQLKEGHPVIVFIRSRSGAGHYVVIHHRDKKGKYVVHDPLFGPNIFLDTSKKLVSAIYKSGVVIDQMIVYE